MLHSSQPDAGSVALLVDGENIGASFASHLLSHARRYGPVIIKRVYGNAKLMNGWCESPSFRVVHSGTGKNAADIHLAIEAVDLVHTDKVNTFVLASSDGDFCHLAHRLSESGRHIVGIGMDKTPETFRKSCSEFYELKAPRPKQTQLEPLDAQIRAVIETSSGAQDLKLNSLNALMRREYDVKISEHPQKNWRKYLESKPDLYRCDAKGPDARVALVT